MRSFSSCTRRPTTSRKVCGSASCSSRAAIASASAGVGGSGCGASFAGKASIFSRSSFGGGCCSGIGGFTVAPLLIEVTSTNLRLPLVGDAGEGDFYLCGRRPDDEHPMPGRGLGQRRRDGCPHVLLGLAIHE